MTPYFPQATAHFEAARLAMGRLHAGWSGLLDDGLFDTGIATSPNGETVIVAYRDWPPACAARAHGRTEEMRR